MEVRATMRYLRRSFSRLARRKRLSIALVGLLAFLGCAATAARQGLPVPLIHDEFSYLLGADTFAGGRWTNPPHPLWVGFESIHIIQQPTYSSKYPPGQALFLAAGQLIWHPILGVWLSVALGCAALCWTLQAWLPPRWALVGALIASARIVFGGAPLLARYTNPDWAQGYFGGGVAFLGGCIVLGAARRLTTRPQVLDSLVLGLGLALLANSRPFEGLVLCLPVGVMILRWLCGTNRPPCGKLMRLAVPLAGVLVATAALMMIHNAKVTGDPLTLPYVVHAEQYEVAPVFRFQSMRREPEIRHNPIYDLHVVWAGGIFMEQTTWTGWADVAGRKSTELWCYYLGPSLTWLLLLLPWVLLRRDVHFALFGIATMVLVLLVVSVWCADHYAAPVTGLIVLLWTVCLRRLSLCRARGIHWGRWLVRLTVLWCCVVLPLWWLTPNRSLGPDHWAVRRGAIIEQLRDQGGRHVIVVEYAPDHVQHLEWVYNEADIDNAPVIWVRYVDESYQKRLREHYPNRLFWSFRPDSGRWDLVPLP